MAVSFLHERVYICITQHTNECGIHEQEVIPKMNIKMMCLNTYPQLVNFLLKKYETEEVISETESEITRFTQPAEINPSQYPEELVARFSTTDMCKKSTQSTRSSSKA